MSLQRRQQISQRAAQLLSSGCVIIDLETTGLPGVDVEIIEVAVIDHTGTVLLNTLVKPENPIPKRASQVNDIYDHDVADAPCFPDVYTELYTLLHERCAVAYNYTFEQSVLRTVYNRYTLTHPESQWSCAMRSYQGYRGHRHFSKLTDACVYEGVVVENAHRALGDCLMTLSLLHKMASAASKL